MEFENYTERARGFANDETLNFFAQKIKLTHYPSKPSLDIDTLPPRMPDSLRRTLLGRWSF